MYTHRERDRLGISVFFFSFQCFPFLSQHIRRSDGGDDGRSIVAYGPRGPIADAAHGVERQPFGTRVLPSEQRTVFRFRARYELLARERMREAAHVQTLDVPVPVYPDFALERHPLVARVGCLFWFRVVGVLFRRVAVQILGWRQWPDGSRGNRLQGRGGAGWRPPAQQERLPGRRWRYRAGGGRLPGDRRERGVRLEREVGIRERLERTRLERRWLKRGRLERHRQGDGRRLRLLQRRIPVYRLRLCHRLPVNRLGLCDRLPAYGWQGLCRLSHRLNVVRRAFRMRNPWLKIIIVILMSCFTKNTLLWTVRGRPYKLYFVTISLIPPIHF